MTPSVEIVPIGDAAGRKRFVRFAWQVYADDPHWVPPLIGSRLKELDPARGPFFRHGEAALFMARRGGRDLGTIVAWINHRANAYRQEQVAGFGYFEVLEDYPAAEALLSTAANWARTRGMTLLRGPLHFSTEDSPGVLIEGFDRPPVLLMGHSPPYYADFLTRFGLRKYRDAYAYRVEVAPFGGEISNLPPKILRAAEVARRRYGASVRPLRLEAWEDEVRRALALFNQALGYQREHVPMAEAEFRHFAEELRPIVDPALTLFVEVDGEPVGLSITLPDFNQVLRRMNGRLFPLGWLRFWWYRRRITVVSVKILGVLERYRGRGLDALLYVETARQILARGYDWVDFSLIAEENVMANRLAQMVGGQVYKVYRTYQMAL
ncbi:MAG: N-acetyltransferase [Chloroflexi bacterium]|nr:MAG: N-acetyltransferase [Chloroflexota bacterium]